MAMTCSTCGYYTVNDENACPTCKTKLSFTLLPPRGVKAEALDLPERTIHAAKESRGRGLFGLFDWVNEHGFLCYYVILPTVVIVLSLFGFMSESVDSAYERVRPGMAIVDVYPMMRPRIGAQMTILTEVESTGAGELRMTFRGGELIIHYANGRVVSRQIRRTNP